MPMSRQAKEDTVAELTEKLGRATGGLIANFTGLNVEQVTEIRSTLREANAEYKVVKNTLMKRALAGTTVEGLADSFAGPTAILLKFDEEFGALGKAAKDLVKKFEKFEVKGGFIEEEILSGDIVETMASLPTLDEARAQLLGVINAPAANLLAQFNAPASNLIGVIQAKKDKDETAA